MVYSLLHSAYLPCDKNSETITQISLLIYTSESLYHKNRGKPYEIS
jgi:hypothetical protein